VDAIRGSTGNIDDDTILSNLLRAFLPIYAIRVFTKQEQRFVLFNDLTLEGLLGKLTTFELSNFDNFKSKNFVYAFKYKLSLK